MATNKVNKVNAPVLSDYSITNYIAAQNKVLSYLEMLKSDFKAKYDNDIVSFFQYRIKDNESLINKLQRDKLPITEEAAMKNLNDIVGLRIVCPNLLYVQIIIELLKKSTSFKIINEKDYISHPKDSGYRSYHLIVEVPVDLVDGLKVIRVEIQIRTLLMHAWSNFEHDKCYKKDIVDQELHDSLKQRSDLLFDMDLDMMSQLVNERKSIDGEMTSVNEYIHKLIRGKSQ